MIYRHPHGTGITSGTSAAAAGGITTVVDMPLNSDPVTTNLEQLLIKQGLAKVSEVAHSKVPGWWCMGSWLLHPPDVYLVGTSAAEWSQSLQKPLLLQINCAAVCT